MRWLVPSNSASRTKNCLEKNDSWNWNVQSQASFFSGCLGDIQTISHRKDLVQHPIDGQPFLNPCFRFQVFVLDLRVDGLETLPNIWLKFPQICSFTMLESTKHHHEQSNAMGKPTLQGINISPNKPLLELIFLFPKWDMLVPWRVHDSFSWSQKSFGKRTKAIRCRSLSRL